MQKLFALSLDLIQHCVQTEFTTTPSHSSFISSLSSFTVTVLISNWQIHVATNQLHTHPFNSPFSGTTQPSQYQKGKPIWILLKQETVSGRGISWTISKSLQTDYHASTTPLSFLQAGCPSCRPTNSVKALKANNELISAC